MTFTRVAGPLGRKFGFEGEIGKLRFAFNAGWYVFSINWRGSWYWQMSTDPIRLDWYAGE